MEIISMNSIGPNSYIRFCPRTGQLFGWISEN